MKTEILTFDNNGVFAAATDLFARVALVTLFFLAGTNKLQGYEATAGWMEAMGIPGVLLPLVILAEVGGAIAIVVIDIIWRRIGGQSMVGAVDLTQFCVMAAASWAIPYAFLNKKLIFSW